MDLENDFPLLHEFLQILMIIRNKVSVGSGSYDLSMGRLQLQSTSLVPEATLMLEATLVLRQS